MSEEEVIYVNFKCLKSKKPKDKRSSAHRKKGHGCPQHIVRVSLGILCFVLLLESLALLYMYFQKYGKCENVTGLERNVTFTPEVKYHSTLTTFTGKKNQTASCHGEWSCCIKNGYYISTERKTWHESKRSCQGRGGSLLKIDDKEEERFIQAQIKNDYWIGLHKKGNNTSWLWLDNSGVLQHLRFQLSSNSSDKCGYIESSFMSTGNCVRKIYYICEKKFYYPYN